MPALQLTLKQEKNQYVTWNPARNYSWLEFRNCDRSVSTTNINKFRALIKERWGHESALEGFEYPHLWDLHDDDDYDEDDDAGPNGYTDQEDADDEDEDEYLGDQETINNSDTNDDVSDVPYHSDDDSNHSPSLPPRTS